MDHTKPHWGIRIWKGVKVAFWLLIGYVILMQVLAPRRLESARADLLDQFQQQRKSRVIAMIHRQDTVSLFGVPVSSSISIEDSEAVLRAIRLTPPDQPIDLILHTPGGAVACGRADCQGAGGTQRKGDRVCAALRHERRHVDGAGRR